MSGWGGKGGMVTPGLGCFSQGNLVSALKTITITGSIRSQVFDIHFPPSGSPSAWV